MPEFATQTSPRSKKGKTTTQPKKAIAKPKKAAEPTLAELKAQTASLGLTPPWKVLRSKKLLKKFLDDFLDFPDTNSPSWKQVVGSPRSVRSSSTVWTTDFLSPRIYGQYSPVPVDSAFFQPDSPFWDGLPGPSFGDFV